MKRLFTACVVVALMAISPAAMSKTTTIGVSMALFDDNFLTILRQAMADYAKTQPDVELQFQDAQGDVGRQLSQVQNFVAQGVDAMIVNLVDASATKSMTQAAASAGIPLVYVNRQPDETEFPGKVVVVASDDLVAGRLQGTELVKRMGDKGIVVIMLGDLANNATHGRTTGVKEIFAKYPGIKIIEEQTANFERGKAIDLMNNWISKGDKIDAVSSNNDEMALGAIIAMRQAGLDPHKIPVGGVDATPDGLAAIAKGDLAVTVFQDAKGQGKRSVDDALKLIRGEKVQTRDIIPYELVTAENYKEYLNR
ncbi:MAG: sugar ABC transporter substrate-binding protein [Acetobacteraceae bacterium]|nr:sugar ABC transporter substrate-binding protein [Acetobacteraceae bacterium]